jgi:hypothetical protein
VRFDVTKRDELERGFARAADYLHGVILPVDGGWLAR